MEHDVAFFGLTEDETRVLDTLATCFAGRFSFEDPTDQETFDFLMVRLDVVTACKGWRTVEVGGEAPKGAH
jgi:RNA binding exosome subunit